MNKKTNDERRDREEYLWLVMALGKPGRLGVLAAIEQATTHRRWWWVFDAGLLMVGPLLERAPQFFITGLVIGAISTSPKILGGKQ